MKSFIKTISFLIFIISVLSGCSSSGSSSEAGLKTGRFIDSNVQGLEYETDTQLGVTDSLGRFYYKTGETITFYVGNIELGKTYAKAVVTPIDLIEDAEDENHPHVINIARFLQSIDYDADPENGIKITDQINNIAYDYDISFNQSIEDFEDDVQPFFNDLNASEVFFNKEEHFLCSAQDAAKHLSNTINPSDTDNTKEGGGGDSGGDSGGSDSGGGDSGGG